MASPSKGAAVTAASIASSAAETVAQSSAAAETSSETSTTQPTTSSTSTTTSSTAAPTTTSSEPTTTTANTGATSVTSSSATDSAALATSTSAASSGGLSPSGTIAVAVVVPVVSVAVIILALLFFWRKRKATKAAEEERPGRKASTNLSSGVGGLAMSEGSGPGYHHGPTPSDGTVQYSDGTRPDSGEIVEPIGVLGAVPVAANNRNGDIHRGPSNASSAYSAANRSDASEESHMSAVHPSAGYYGENPYYGDINTHGAYGGEDYQPVIRDVQARRNTRIENPGVYPRQAMPVSRRTSDRPTDSDFLQ
ncbi:hypothetical protein N7453_006471 [Penicillium expansum]|nr:hypothetical protein N7453_006471 [Penicillium expansum]